MKVKELIEILKEVDGELPVATHALESNYFSDKHADGVIEKLDVKVSLVHHWSGMHLMIGNQKNKNICGRECHVIKDIHGETQNDFKIEKFTSKEKREPAKLKLYRITEGADYKPYHAFAFEVQLDQIENAKKLGKKFGLKVECINSIMFLNGKNRCFAAEDGNYIIRLPWGEILVRSAKDFTARFEALP